jgi:hypothetical protein
MTKRRPVAKESEAEEEAGTTDESSNDVVIVIVCRCLPERGRGCRA